MKYKLFYGNSNSLADDYIRNELKLTYSGLGVYQPHLSYIVLDEEQAMILKLKYPDVKLSKLSEA